MKNLIPGFFGFEYQLVAATGQPIKNLTKLFTSCPDNKSSVPLSVSIGWKGCFHWLERMFPMVGNRASIGWKQWVNFQMNKIKDNYWFSVNYLFKIFGSFNIIYYLCSAFKDVLRIKAAAQHSSSELGSAFALHFICNVNQVSEEWRVKSEEFAAARASSETWNLKLNSALDRHTETKLLTLNT